MTTRTGSSAPPSEGGSLAREVGLPGAVLLGLGSILGTGIFVSAGLAAGVAGPAVILAALLAAAVAALNGLSSAQLAAAHPVSGGTYEYGYRFLRPWLGFSAGSLFVLAKTASAATAALGFAGYLAAALRVDADGVLVPVALAAVVLLTVVVAGGIRRSAAVNAVVVGLTLAALLSFAVFGLPAAFGSGAERFGPFFGGRGAGAATEGLLHATALLFVAYTGYGRIATLGEEVREPRRTIPRAILATVGLTFVLYAAVLAAAIGRAGAPAFAAATEGTAAPLEVIARDAGRPGLAWLLAIGAVTAMLGVLLNLLLGVSRVLLAMGRRGDAPRRLGRLSGATPGPRAAVLATGGIVAALVLVGDVKTAWSFSAVTVLVYYGLTNLAALRLPAEHRLYPRWTAVAGLLGCFSLVFFVDPRHALAAAALLALALAARALADLKRR